MIAHVACLKATAEFGCTCYTLSTTKQQQQTATCCSTHCLPLKKRAMTLDCIHTSCPPQRQKHQRRYPSMTISHVYTNLVADAVCLFPQCRARLPSIHPRLQLLDVAHRLPCDFVVHLQHQQQAHENNNKKRSNTKHARFCIWSCKQVSAVLRYEASRPGGSFQCVSQCRVDI